MAALGWPVFVKPARAGSSMGISKVHAAGGAGRRGRGGPRRTTPRSSSRRPSSAARSSAACWSRCDGGPPRPAPLGEIEVLGGGHEFYDFEAKYLDEEHLRLTCPADVPDEVADEMADLAVRAFEALGCEGLARVDFFSPRRAT